MEITKIKIKGAGGLHLRPAAKVVQSADSCSILELVSLGVSQNGDIAVIAEGPDEKQVIQEMVGLFNDGAGI